jgi:hypothetical protein
VSTAGKITWVVVGGALGLGGVVASVHGGVTGNERELGIGAATAFSTLFVLWRRFW